MTIVNPYSSAVRLTAQRIRADLLALGDGKLLGSEEEMVARYGVSRPTLRQAASILTQEQLVTIRRGVGGGYFSRVPGTRGVAHSAAVYLLAHSTTMEEIIQAVAPIKAELARLACRSTDANLRAALIAYAEDEPPEMEHVYRTFLRSERHFSKILGSMSQNKVLSLFLNILYDFVAQIPPELDVYRRHNDRVRAYWRARSGMVRAILDNDEEVAAIFAKRCAMMVASWMSDDLNDRMSEDFLSNMLTLSPKDADGPKSALSRE